MPSLWCLYWKYNCATNDLGALSCTLPQLQQLHLIIAFNFNNNWLIQTNINRDVKDTIQLDDCYNMFQMCAYVSLYLFIWKIFINFFDNIFFNS